MAETRKTWKDQGEVDAFKPKLLEMLEAAAWRRPHPKWKEYRQGMEESDEKVERAYKLLQRKRLSAGQALILRCKIKENELKQLKGAVEAGFLEELDKLGIDREWKNNEGNEGNPRLLFHFHTAQGNALELDLTDEEPV